MVTRHAAVRAAFGVADESRQVRRAAPHLRRARTRLSSMRDGVEECRATTFAQHTGDAFQVRANSEQPNDQRRVSNEMTSGDDAAHGVF